MKIVKMRQEQKLGVVPAIYSSGYVEIAAPKGLSPFVDACWFYQPDFSGPKWDILIPEGVVDVIFNFGAPYYRQPVSGVTAQGVWIQHDVIIGQRTRLFSVRWPMCTRLFAVRIKAEAAQYLVSKPLTLLADQAHRLPGRSLNILAKQLHAMRFDDCANIADITFRHFSEMFAQSNQGDTRLIKALQAMRQRHGDIEVSRLCEEVGVNRRTLERLFADKIGVTPKFFAQTLRLHHFLCCYCPQASENLTASAIEARYYDQSHFIKEFKRFTGASPTVFFDAPPDIYQPLMVSLTGRLTRS